MSEDMQQWDPPATAPTQCTPLTKVQREHVAQTWQLVQPS